MKIHKDLVWDKHTGNSVGYMDLGNAELHAATLKKQMICFSCLVFLVRNFVNPIKFTLANFDAKNFTAA